MYSIKQLNDSHQRWLACQQQALHAEFAVIAKALAHPHRLELLEHAAQGATSVETLADRVSLSVANASQHLRHLREAGLMTAEREGKFVRYTLADDAVLDLIASVHRVAARRRAEVARIVAGYFDARDAMEPISRAELVKRARDGTVTVIDVRSEDEFALGHVPGALWVPLEALESRLAELDPAKPVVAYCRGPLVRPVLRGGCPATRSGLRRSPPGGWLS